MDSLSSFRNRHAGATILVCGCGASLNELEHPEQFLTIGVNDVGRRFQPDYLVVVNPRSQFKGDRFRYVETSLAKNIFTQLDLGLGLPGLIKFRLGQYGGTDLSDPEVLHHTRNSPYVAVCLAALMGAKRIGLIGVDFTDHHFFAKTGRHPLAASLDRINQEYKKLGAALTTRGIEVLNLSSISRLDAFRRSSVQALTLQDKKVGPNAVKPLMVVSYATTPVAGVPVILARCIRARTEHTSCCVWASSSYGNGVCFDRDIQWSESPTEAAGALAEADVVIVHNGKVDSAHAPLLQNKAVITLAHNYFWNVDDRYVKTGLPGLVVGQYQATLAEFAGWATVPNPVPLWEEAFKPQPKPDTVTVCYTPSGKHERYAPGNRLYWHAKGYDTTMRVLNRLADRYPVRLEVIRDRQVSHAEALAMKRRSHIIVDECVTGSYHRNSLEGLATGCVVVNGVGLLPAVEEVLRRCAPASDRSPFVFATLETLETVLSALIEQGPGALVATGSNNRAWMERHWDFSTQWSRFWQPAVEAAQPGRLQNAPRGRVVVKQSEDARHVVKLDVAADGRVAVVIPHGGRERLPLLVATMASLRQAPAVGDVIVVEMGVSPVAAEVALRWGCRHLFIEHADAFERARALNAGSALVESDLVLWHDNDLIVPPEFIMHCVGELRERGLDYLVPYTSIRYLSEADSLAVLHGVRNPEDCRPVTTMHSAHRGLNCSGGSGLVRREFLERHGGHIEGFRGWGGEDNAWIHKVTLLGRSSTTARQDQHIYHLYHPLSGGYRQMEPGHLNPYYAANVDLLGRVAAVRQPAQLVQEFPPSTPAAGVLTQSNTGKHAPPSNGLAVWTYWEGPCPAWIRACRRTIAEHAPRLRVLNPESFDLLRDRDRDIDLSCLHAPHRADYIRAFLLWRYGGLWIDADCLVLQSLQKVLDLLASHDFVGHRERSGLVSNGFIAAQPGSRIASEFYDRVSETLRARRPLGWTSLGSTPLNSVLAAGHRWYELPCKLVQPICWSRPEAFFTQRGPGEHALEFDSSAICYMLSNVAISKHSATHRGPDLLDERTFFTFLLRRALGRAGDSPSDDYEEVFATHAELYLSYRHESVSGPGSSLAATKELRERLPLLLEDLAIRTLIDAPCGDLNWMQHVQLGLDEYIGVDILGENIANNEWRHGSPRRRFMRVDVIRDPVPKAHALLCRDLLPHLSFGEISRVLGNFVSSGTTFLITTHFTGARPNLHTTNGAWRTLNLELPPFGFPPPMRLINEKCTEDGGRYADKCLAVWRLADLASCLATL